MRPRLITLLAVIALLLTACGSPPAAQPPAAPTEASAASGAPSADIPVLSPQPASESAPLRIVNSFEVASLSPAQGSHWFVRFGSAETPMRVDEQFVIQPWLITSVEQLDPLTWQLRVREGISFQNGKPLTAEAMAGAINWQLENSAGAKASLPGARAEAVGAYELRLITATPEPTMIALLADEGVFPIHDVTTVQSVGEDYAALAGKGIYAIPQN